MLNASIWHLLDQKSVWRRSVARFAVSVKIVQQTNVAFRVSSRVTPDLSGRIARFEDPSTTILRRSVADAPRLSLLRVTWAYPVLGRQTRALVSTTVSAKTSRGSASHSERVANQRETQPTALNVTARRILVIRSPIEYRRSETRRRTHARCARIGDKISFRNLSYNMRQNARSA